ncbi:hypothetical protein RFI_14101 [Reticulomyxa filosa]|uniref:Prolyl 4-hydroxylase alpha subunit domain-containing protein n=1 Tax=Reticulomyxa filosa TaxID=46433 RepID=X6NBD8_RETFI|nr:hypothetical protein RFI_14101 [Reticulomyxa filosa]|eukprot:ETO23084.1 hypothetical protein RFI_14101 [Reticulomyxa filosa]
MSKSRKGKTKKNISDKMSKHVKDNVHKQLISGRMLWCIVPLLVVVLGFLNRKTPLASDGACDSKAQEWLNHDFPMKGYHLLCLGQKKTSISLTIYSPMETTSTTNSTRTLTVGEATYSKITWDMNTNNCSWSSFQEIREEVSQKLNINPSKRTRWGMYSSEGKQINDLMAWTSLLSKCCNSNSISSTMTTTKTFANSDDQLLLLLFEGGVFIYPGVRLNYQRSIRLSDSNVYNMTTLSLQPLMFSVHDFISEVEQSQLIDLTQQMIHQMTPSDVVESDSYSHWRTSSTAWIDWNTSVTNDDVSYRIGLLLNIPFSHQEKTQVLRYRENEKYGLHLDYFDSPNMRSANRVATVLWYMNDVPIGGQTIFPMQNNTVLDKIYNLYSIQQCQEFQRTINALLVTPEKGKVVIFYNLQANGELDDHSIHGSCPVGPNLTKWAANKWIWNIPQHTFQFHRSGLI